MSRSCARRFATIGRAAAIPKSSTTTAKESIAFFTLVAMKKVTALFLPYLLPKK